MDLYKAGIHIMSCCDCGGNIMPGEELYGKPLPSTGQGESKYLPWCLDCGNRWLEKQPWHSG